MISAVVLTHNDEGILTRTLESLTWCDEIVVIDDYSTDSTRSVAQKFTSAIFSRRVNGDFSEQRNFGLSKAKGEWILFVDSDEVVSDTLIKEIKKSINLSCAGFYLRRKDFLFERWLTHGETGRVRLLRLARKNAGTWVRPVHEVWNVKGLVGELHEPLLHFPHPNVAQFIEEINFYSTINAHYLFDQKVRAHGWHIVAYPKLKFFINYFWYLGFLDGTAGAVTALMMSMHSFLTRAKLWLLWREHKRAA